MKKAIVIPVVLVLFVLGAFLGPLLFAQAPPANVPSGTKVLIVNIRAVLTQHARAKALQVELEEAIKPHKLTAERLSKEIDTMKLSADVLAKKKTEWEAVNNAILQLIEAKHKEKLPAVWNEIEEAIADVAKCYGMQLVLGYGDPDDPELKSFQNNKHTKLRTIDMGCTAVLYQHASVDITPIVIETLAHRAKSVQPAQGKNLPGNR